jgi:hypothetical protein
LPSPVLERLEGVLSGCSKDLQEHRKNRITNPAEKRGRVASMTGPPSRREVPDTVSRGSREKQPRAFEETRRVPVVGEDDVLVELCSQESIRRYLGAPNAEVKRRTDGSIRLVRLRSLGDDRGYVGERYGRSTVTTERVHNDYGELVGSAYNLQHKRNCDTWGNVSGTLRDQDPIPRAKSDKIRRAR